MIPLGETYNSWRRVLTRTSRLWARYLTGLVPEERRFWLLVPAVGVGAGLTSVAWLRFLRLVEHLGWQHGGTLLEMVSAATPLQRVLVPLAGGLVVVLTALLVRGMPSPHGTSGLIATLVARRGRMSLLPSLRDSAASLTVVGCGASAGREGALIHTGAALGSWLGTRMRLSEQHVKLLLAAGAAGGIAAAYDAPIGATVFAMEVLLGTFALQYFGPIIIAAAISTTVTRRLLGEPPPYVVASYYGQGFVDMLPDLVLGVVVGLVAIGFIRLFASLDARFSWLKRLGRMRPLAAMGALGLAGIFLPQLYGNGYDTVNLVLNPAHGMPLMLLLVLAATKLFFTALCRAGGISGGLFTPSLFIGAMIGSAFGTTAGRLLPWALALPPTYALIGMGAILAGTMQAPITAVLMIFEMTSDYSMILPLMLACTASTLVCHLFQPESLYTEPLRRRGIRLPHHDAPAWLHQPTVHDFVSPRVEGIPPEAPYEEVVSRFMSAPDDTDHLYVVDGQRSLRGTISLPEIRRWYAKHENAEGLCAADIMDADAPFVCVDDPITRAMDVLAGTDHERLPVLRDARGRRLLGTLSKRAVLAAFRDSNLQPLFSDRSTPRHARRRKAPRERARD